MNLSVPPSSGLSLILLALLIIWAVLLWRRPSVRARQWLLKSTLLGAALGPILVYALHPTMLRVLSWLPDQGLWLEFTLIAGLSWGLVATLLKALPIEPGFPQPVEIQWRRYLASLMVILVIVATMPYLPLSQSLLFSAVMLTAAVLTSAWFPARLLSGLIGALMMVLPLALLSIATTSVWQGLPRYWQLMTAVHVGSDWPTLILAFSIGLAIPGLTAWWLGQPQRSSN